MVKNKIRKTLFEKGQSLSIEYKIKTSRLIQLSVIKEINLKSKNTVLLYSPFRNEISLDLVTSELKKYSKNLYLPKVIDTKTIKFNQIEDSSLVIKNTYGIAEVVNDKYLDPLLFDVMFIPFIGVDSQGCRLGYGSGYFDRALGSFKTINKKPLVVGLGYDFQIHDEEFGEAHDLMYDIVISEKRVIYYD
tara:strand:+ start:52 stop:621 length:570 start_codon:yes stop_codon:yes gene_type:complete